jgi:hypothetical protein
MDAGAAHALPWEVFLGGLRRSATPKDSLDPIEQDAQESAPLNLRLLDQKAPRSRTGTHPWTLHYWALKDGLIAARYLDSSFNFRSSFSARRAYVENKPLRSVVEGFSWSRRKALDKLSPSEKYDLLVGDLAGTLTESIWKLGERYERSGGIAAWAGICDGSAAASALLPEPVSDLVVRDPIFGHEFTLFASDIKALASLHFSEFLIKTPIVGGRCESPSPGLPVPGTSPSCESINPGSWHRAVLFLNGMKQRPIFIDTSPHAEVWNTPVVSYQFDYFDVRTGMAASNLDQAVVRVAEFKNDPRSLKRAPGTQGVVGVRMTITTATGYATSLNGAHPAQLQKRLYTYELEIDSHLNILGGEWLGDERPDFAWTLAPGRFPKSQADELLNSPKWESDVVPGDWRPAIVSASSKAQTMGAIIRRLVDESSR